LVFVILMTGLSAGYSNCYAQGMADTSRGAILSDSAHRKANVTSSKADGDEAGKTKADVKSKPWQPNPKKAGLYSAIIPGMGQIYNRQYWKVPVIYAGITIAGYFIVNNLDKYQSYRKAYINRINNPNYKDQYTGIYDDPTQLQQLQNEYNKYLDLAVLFTGIGYALQVVDAVTSAHLKNFDISRDISLHMKPVAVPNGLGLALVVNFK
jgi:Family of unknown function (DUF5683)